MNTEELLAKAMANALNQVEKVLFEQPENLCADCSQEIPSGKEICADCARALGE